MAYTDGLRRRRWGSRAPAARPAGAGVLLRSFDEDGRTAVAWTENGHTAVISGIRISRAALYNLAGGPRRPDGSRIRLSTPLPEG